MTINSDLKLKSTWKNDLQAGFSVSLIALPLCLGVAIASGFPPIAGLISAIVGGIFVSRINGSHITITGPAAGLIVVNLTAIESLGGGNHEIGYPFALAAIVVSGILIFILGKLKAGKFGDFFPSSVVHGMLAAIGLIIIFKQLFNAFGVKAQSKELIELIAEVPSAIMQANPIILFIALGTLLILIVHPYIKGLKSIPASVFVLIFGIFMGKFFNLSEEHTYFLNGSEYELGPTYLVNLPNNIMESLTLPDFGKIKTSTFWFAVTSITLVTAIETILSAIAIDILDPFKRKTNINKDLNGIGLGIVTSGFLGGLPMISEIVRSSANINYGAKTHWSNFFHGAFLLVILVFASSIINMIPLAALAAMLIFVGYKLTSPREFIKIYKIGITDFIVFLSTILFVLVIDLLIGIIIGIVINLLFNILKSRTLKYVFNSKIEIDKNENIISIKINGTLTFTNYLVFKNQISDVLKQATMIEIDFAKVKFVDHSVQHHLHEIKLDLIKEGRELYFINQEHLYKKTDHPLADLVLRKPT